MDGMGVYAVAKKIVEKIDVVVAPLLPFGVSYFHMGWPGTMTVKTETYARFVEEMTLSLVQHGAKYIVYLNGHGGNRPGLELAAMNVQMATDARVMIVHSWRVAEVIFEGKLDAGHTGRIETDFALAYDPELVDLEKAVTKPGYEGRIMRWPGSRGDIYTMVRDFREDEWFGDAKGASIEEAQMVVEKVADEIITCMGKTFGSAALLKLR